MFQSILIICSSAFSAPEVRDGEPVVRTPTRALAVQGDVTEVLLDLSLQQTHEHTYGFLCTLTINIQHTENKNFSSFFLIIKIDRKKLLKNPQET